MSVVIDGTNGVSGVAGSAATPAVSDSADAGMFFPAANTVAFSTADTERMRIDSSGNVGIGAASPSVRLDISGATNITSRGRFTNSLQNTTLQLGAFRDTSNVPYIGSETNHAFAFITNDTERMRIDSSGYVFINETATVGTASRFTITTAASSVFGATIKDSGTTYAATTKYMDFLNSSNAVAGSIQHTAVTTTAFSTSSDARLKENIVDAPSATNILNSIPVRSYDWKEDKSHVKFGFVAQELEQIYAEPVGVGGDDVNANPWSIEYGRLTPILVKALQEANAKIDALKSEFDAYKASHP